MTNRTWREEVCPNTAKTSLLDVSLAYSIGKSYGFGGFTSAAEVFQAKIRSQHSVYMHSAEVDALFRVKATFDDVAGIGEARNELVAIVDFLRDPSTISANSEALIAKNGTPAPLATTFASRLFPVPGAPTSSTPFGAVPPRRGEGTLKFHFKSER